VAAGFVAWPLDPAARQDKLIFSITCPVPGGVRPGERSGGMRRLAQYSVIVALALLAFFIGVCFGYDEPSDTVGPLTVRIHEPMLGAYGSGGVLQINRPDIPVPVVVTLSNASDSMVQGTLRIAVIDNWRVDPATPVSFSVGPKGRAEVSFTAYPGSGTYNAHYPIHAFAEFDWNGRRLTAHPILILLPQFPDPPQSSFPLPEALTIPGNGAVALWRVPVHHERTVVESEPHPGTTGLEKHEVVPVARFGENLGGSARRPGIQVNLGPRPLSRREQVLSSTVEFPLELPPSRPIRLSFGSRAEGSVVSFRVLARPLQDHVEAGDRTLWKGNSTPDASWSEQAVDLSGLAGQKVLLQLEARADGPDAALAFWGEPTITAGVPAEPAVFPPAEGARFHSLGRIGNFEVRVWPGRRGILDGTVGFFGASGNLLFNGFRVGVLDDSLNDWRSVAELTEVRDESAQGRLRFRHRFQSWAGSFDVVSEMWCENEVLRVAFRLDNAPASRPWLDVHLESVMTGRWNRRVKRVFSSVGNVVEDPQAFRMDFDGHDLATSFVGFEFADGLSLVQAVDVPPAGLEVEPSDSLYSLNTPGNQVLTFIPAADVWQGAKVWRNVNGLRASPGVSKLAGRFVFDLWGFETSYAEGASGLAKAFQYGLTDAAVVWHNWQRWGYDYRLPDIWPPNPAGGTLEDFRSIARVCAENGVLFAPHDNYIDFYPDAEGFSYDRIVFRRDGTPYKAWFMGARKAQSYRWRPDQVQPVLERNLRLIRDGLDPSAYFIDVWSSMGPYDYWTRDGIFHDRVSTRNAWGEAFAWIREFLGGAPQISEAGHDQLIGWLDGAQTNHLRVDSEDRSFVIHLHCKDSERIPWFDTAHHDRFALHGAGYPGRYEGGLDEQTHGIYSDDYITTEVLTGHPAMVDTAFSRDVVRKYYLLSGLMRALALRRIESVTFDGGNIHRQHIRWENGDVWVNRGPEEWKVGGHSLPQYGFYARIGGSEAAIEKPASGTAEWAVDAESVFVNGRGTTATVAGVTSDGGVRLSRSSGGLVVTPLPGSDAFDVYLALADLPWKVAAPARVEAVLDGGSLRSSQSVVVEGGRVRIRCEPGVFCYRLK